MNDRSPTPHPRPPIDLRAAFPNTIRVARDRDATESRLVALVIGDGIFHTHPLPGDAELTIGRTPANDLQIDHPSISRQHAILRTGPGPMTIEDRGSANGTGCSGQYLIANRPTTLQPGELVDLGAVLLVVQPRLGPTRSRRLWSHDYFEGRLEEECARAASARTQFSVLHVLVESASPAELVETALAEAVRPDEVLGCYAPSQYEILLVDDDPGAATRTVARVHAALARCGARGHVAMACYPRDGSDPQRLLAHLAARRRGDDETPATGPRVVKDGAMESLNRLVERIAQGSINVLILGETGAGKEVMAKRLHRLSPRAAHPLLSLNCGALSESLLESELFGHERGAFTGAHQAKQGLLETARGGTVFLDEVGELPPSIQVKLLRVIEEQCVMPVGGIKPRPIDVRFIAATNRDLEAEVARGRFRQDLFFRLNGISLVIPTLRERVSEIIPLAREFVRAAARRGGLEPPPELSSEAAGLLLRYAWPGNIRELRNVIERAVLLCGDGSIELEHLPTDKMTTALATVGRGERAPGRDTAPMAPRPRPEPPPAPAAPAIDPGPDGDESISTSVRRQVEVIERQRILDALQRCSWNQTLAAEILGITRRTLSNKLNRYAIPRPRKGRKPTAPS